MAQDPVVYLPTEEMLKALRDQTPKENTLRKKMNEFTEWGYKGPGWYFWDETQTFAHGPFWSKDAANQECLLYATLGLKEKVRKPQ
jgi:hypothetical protein